MADPEENQPLPSGTGTQDPSIRFAFATHLRPALSHFAILMEAKLAETDPETGGYKEMPLRSLFDSMEREVAELDRALSNEGSWDQGHVVEMYGNVIAEAVNVANFAMMVADLAREKLLVIAKDAREAAR